MLSLHLSTPEALKQLHNLDPDKHQKQREENLENFLNFIFSQLKMTCTQYLRCCYLFENVLMISPESEKNRMKPKI